MQWWYFAASLFLVFKCSPVLGKRERDWYEIDEPKEGLDAMDNTDKGRKANTISLQQNFEQISMFSNCS